MDDYQGDDKKGVESLTMRVDETAADLENLESFLEDLESTEEST